MSFTLNIIKFIIVDLLWNVVYFPIWWYSRGALKVLKVLWNQVDYLIKLFGLDVQIRYLFQPMFGQRDIVSRIISITIRIVQFIILGIIIILWTGLLVLIFIIYLLLPIIIAYNLFYLLGIIPTSPYELLRPILFK